MLNLGVFNGRMVSDITIKRNNEGAINYGFIKLAHQRSYKNKNGEYETDFVDFLVQSKTAEIIEKHFHKGDGITIRYEITTKKEKKVNNEGKEYEANILSLIANGVEFQAERKTDTHSDVPAQNAGQDAYTAIPQQQFTPQQMQQPISMQQPVAQQPMYNAGQTPQTYAPVQAQPTQENYADPNFYNNTGLYSDGDMEF